MIVAVARPRPPRRARGTVVTVALLGAVLAGCSGGSSGGTASASATATAGAGPAGTLAPDVTAAPSQAASPAGSVAPSSTPAGTSTSARSGTKAQAGGVPGQSCPSVALVRTTLALPVGAPAENASVPDVLVCSYPSGGNPSAAIVRIQGGQTRAGFAAARAAFAKSGQKPVDVAGMFDGAYRGELGSATYGVTRTLVVLRGSTEVLVTAQATVTGLTELAHTMLD